METRTNSDVFAPLIGQEARGCWLGYGNTLFLEFGQPQPLLDREFHPKGQFGLSSDHIEWRIEQRDHVISASEDERATMESGIRELDGKSLLSGKVSPSGDSVLAFSGDLILRTFVIATEEEVRWSLRDRQGAYTHLRRPSAVAATEAAGTSRNVTEMLDQFWNVLYGSEIWQVSADVQHRFEPGYEPSDVDSIRLDFRNSLSDETEKGKNHPVGSLSVDPCTCGLRLERWGEILAASGDSPEKILTHYKQLVGKKLLDISITLPAGDTEFILEDGLTLRCFPATSSSGDIWSISSAPDAEFILGPGGRWSYKGSLS